MLRLGIDVGSTYTKYCVLSSEDKIEECFAEKTPVRQKEYFEGRMAQLYRQKGEFASASCGYGKANVSFAQNTINELTALARGGCFICPEVKTILDIGGQDTKIICHENGKLRDFFINDRCAAGSGMFLINTLRLLEMDYDDIDLESSNADLALSSICAVFAQTEITELIAANVPPEDIVNAVIRHILLQAKSLLGKLEIKNGILLSGGFTEIKGFEAMACRILETECVVKPYGKYMSAIGCALSCGKTG